jgi:hypothetical protein
LRDSRHIENSNAAIQIPEPSPNLPQKPKFKPIDKNNSIKGLSLSQLVDRCSTAVRNDKFSPLCTVHFSGISRRPISEIRTVMERVGVDNTKIKNISFVGDSIMEIITFERYATDLANTLKDARKLQGCQKLLIDPVQFDPLAHDNIKRKDFTMSPEQVLRERLKKVLENLQERQKTQASLRRTVRFVELCIKTTSLNPSAGKQVEMETSTSALPDSVSL